MATIIRPEVSNKNKYWISKHRHYELKHFCLQYPIWKKSYNELLDYGISVSNLDREIRVTTMSDPTSRNAIMRTYYDEKIKMVENIAYKTDRYLHKYILKAVTEGHSYVYLRSMLGIPCSRDVYYTLYRKFFWLLSQERY